MKCPSIAGLSHRLVLEAPQRLPDGSGGAVVTWSEVLTAWAEVTAKTGSETLVADGLEARVTHTVRIRYRAGLSPAMRWRSGSRLLAIRAVLDRDGRRRWLECLCEEITP
jgi:SPP1 family predicted phage head-tail adaptor